MHIKYKVDFSRKNLKLKLDNNIDKKQVQIQQLKLKTRKLPQKIIVKQRCQSDPKFRKKIYKCVKLFDKDEIHWNQQLKVQLTLGQAIEQFQKIQLNRNMQPTKKLTIRQAYQLKRQISRVIEQKQHFFIQHRLFEELKDKIFLLLEVCLDDKQKQKLLNFNFLLHLRYILQVKQNQENQIAINYKLKRKPIIPMRSQSVQKNMELEIGSLKFQYQQSVIELINNYISNWKVDTFNQADVARIKILTIVSLHILKIKSPNITLQQIPLISKTIDLKKQLIIQKEPANKKEKRNAFQSIMYLLFKFYKILYYLKIDEQLKFNHYDQLSAYLQLYSADIKHFNIFQQKYQIKKQLNCIKPACVGINIYLDSKQRNQIKFQSLKKQICHNQQSHNSSQKFKISIKNAKNKNLSNISNKSQQKLQNEMSDSFTSNNSFDSSNNSSKNIINANQIKERKQNSLKIPQKYLRTNSRLSIFQNIQNNKKITNNYQLISQSSTNNKFEWIFLKSDQLYKGTFQVIFSNAFSFFQIVIKIICPSGYILNFQKIKSLKNVAQDLKIESFRKIIWSVFKKIFITDFIEEENPIHLKYDILEQNHIKTYIPNDLHIKQTETISLIHDYLIYWLHTRKLKSFFNGKSFYVPCQSSEQLNIFLQNLQNEKDRKNFSKRRGYVNLQSSHNKSGIRYNNLYKSILNQSCQNQENFNQQCNSIQETQDNSSKVKEFIILQIIKVRDQFKLIKVSFSHCIRQIFIFQLGYLKHTRTNQLQSRIKQIRYFSLKYLKNIKKVNQLILALIQNKSLTKIKQRQLEESTNSKPFLKQEFKIKQLFQIDLIQNKMLENSQIQIKLYQKQSQKNRQQRTKIYYKRSQNQINKIFFKRNTKIQIVSKKNHKWGIKYLAYKNQYFILNKGNQNEKQKSLKGFFMRIQMYKVFLLEFQEQNNEQKQNYSQDNQKNQQKLQCKYINCQKNSLKKKIIKNQKQTQIGEYVCSYKQNIFLQIAKHRVVKANNKFYILNFYKSIKNHNSIPNIQQIQKNQQFQQTQNNQFIQYKQDNSQNYFIHYNEKIEIQMIELVDIFSLSKYMKIIKQDFLQNKMCLNLQGVKQKGFKRLNQSAFQNEIIAVIDFQRKTYVNAKMDKYTHQMNQQQSINNKRQYFFSHANHYYQMWLKTKCQSKTQKSIQLNI